MGIQTSMGSHKLDIRKGDRTGLIDYTGTLGQTASVDNAINAGRVCSLTAGGVLEGGIAVGRLPFFAWSGNDINNSPDVTRTRGMPLSGTVQFGTVTVFAACELASTEFLTSDAGLTGSAKLTAISNSPTTAGQAGLLRTQAAGTDMIVGILSPAGRYTAPDGYDMIGFYPYFVAGTTVTNA